MAQVKYDEDDDSLEAIVWREQQSWKKKADTTKFQGKTKPDLYKEARRIDLMIDKAMMMHFWDKVYYFLFLYINICVNNSLHKGGTEDSEIVRDNLHKIEKLVDRAKKGMLRQYRHARLVEEKELERKHQEDLAKAALKATPAVPIVVTPTSHAEDDLKAQNLTLEQMNGAMDALRMPGQKLSSIPQAILATTPAVVGTVVKDLPSVSATSDMPPPSYTTASKFGGMTSQCSISEATITTLALKTVLGDGSCAFRSIAQGMHKGRLAPDQEKRKADELRRLVVQLLQERGNEEMVGTGMTIEQVVLLKDNCASYEAYCNAMARSEYAGETEFWLLAEELQIRIAIFMSSEDHAGGLEHLITYGTAPKPPVCLFWQRGTRSEAGNHYDCLLPE